MGHETSEVSFSIRGYWSITYLYIHVTVWEIWFFLFHQMLKINCLFISKTLTKLVSGLCNNLPSKIICYIYFLIRWLKWLIAQTIMDKMWTCTGHWSNIIIDKLYVRYTRKHSKDSVTYVDITAELIVVFIIKIHYKNHQIFSNTM